jgi:hypothetical protein
MRIRLNEGVA